MTVTTASDGTDVWVLPGNTLLAISDEATYVQPFPAGELERLRIELLVEGVPADVGLSNASKIPHKKLVTAVGNEKDCKLEFRYSSLAAHLTSHGIATLHIELADADTLTEVLESLRDHASEKAKLKRKVYSPVGALVLPAVIMVFIALGTWVFAGGLGDFSEHRPSSRHLGVEILVQKLVVAIGPTGVILIGCVAGLACAWWGYKRYKNPPITVTVRP